MSRPSDAEINHAINTLSHRTAAGFIQEAQRLQAGGLPATLATSMVMDAALMAAAPTALSDCLSDRSRGLCVISGIQPR